MAYAKTAVTAGSPLLSATVQGNLEGLSKYLGGGMLDTDLQTSSEWVETKHLMKPAYHAVSNSMEFVSGFQGGKFRTAPKDLMTMVTKFNTARSLATVQPVLDAPFNFIGNTAIELRCPRMVRYIMVQYTIAPQTPRFHVDNVLGGENTTQVCLAIQKGSELTLDGINKTVTAVTDPLKAGSSSYTYSENSADGAQIPFNIGRKPMSGFWMLKTRAADYYRIALVGRSDCPYTRFINWTISVEAWI
tara:strand:- start:13677 stop:14414 length:738 start_codon:yes stop_codon:yes gene_type:complete